MRLPVITGVDEQVPSRAGTSLIRAQRRLISAGQLGPLSDAGAFNPGSVVIDDQLYLLCRAEPDGSNWVHGELFRSRATPILCRMKPDLTLQAYHEISCNHAASVRPEDWRLFQHRERIYATHCVYMGTNMQSYCSAAVSELNIADRRMVNQVILEPPFPRRYSEKNWVMFSHGHRLLCLYSVVPYVLLEIDLEQGKTRTVLHAEDPGFAIGDRFGGTLYNSTNPIPWDADHYVTFVHHRFESVTPLDRNRLYLQFALLIDRHTLLPASFIPDPVVSGGMSGGRHHGVHYTMSLMAAGDLLYAFYGEGDSHSGVVLFDRAGLDDEFRKHYLQPGKHRRYPLLPDEIEAV